MTASYNHSTLLPQTSPGAGQLLWGEPARKQPIAPLVLMAVVLLLVAAPSALAGSGGSSNPITLMKQIARSTYDLTGLMQQSNTSLAKIDEHSKHLIQIQAHLGKIAGSTQSMSKKTAQLNARLGVVGTAVHGQREKLVSINDELGKTASGMGGIRTSVGTSLDATRGVVRDFDQIDASIGGMGTDLRAAIAAMGASAPLTKEFAQNTTRVAVSGGDGKRYGIPNLAPNNRVMSVVLPMIVTMQKGGPLPARKDSHTASNPLVGAALSMKVPDGTNVAALVRPYDGYYGLPPEEFFVSNRIYGF